MLSQTFFWTFFKTTGSVQAYLLYKHMAPQGSHS
jgi:hypothetical protein